MSTDAFAGVRADTSLVGSRSSFRRLSGLLGLHKKPADVYPLLDWGLTVRIGGWLWLVGAAASVAMLPFVAHEQAIGIAGWMLAVLDASFATVAGVYLIVRGAAVPPLLLLAMGFAGAVGLGVAELVTGPLTAYALLFLILAAYQASVHPASRFLPLLAFIAFVQTASALNDSMTAQAIADAVVAAILLCLVATMAMINARTSRSLSAKLERQRKAAERRAMTDPLTGLGNRRAFADTLARQVAASDRYQRPLAIVMADVDGFKSVNDRFGHDAGDAALIAVARAVEQEVRGPDSCFRWGGDEFVLLLPETSGAGGDAVAHRIRDAVLRDARLPGDEPLFITWGLATLRPGERAEDFVARADLELLSQKRDVTYRDRAGVKGLESPKAR